VGGRRVERRKNRIQMPHRNCMYLHFYPFLGRPRPINFRALERECESGASMARPALPKRYATQLSLPPASPGALSTAIEQENSIFSQCLLTLFRNRAATAAAAAVEAKKRTQATRTSSYDLSSEKSVLLVACNDAPCRTHPRTQTRRRRRGTARRKVNNKI
jgi:hypothetical protein